MIRPVFSTELDAQLGIETVHNNLTVSVYPNPSENTVTIDIPEEKFSGATIYSLSGARLMDVIERTFSVVDLSSGIYLLRINGVDQPVRICRQ
jgi:hypothetical protein